MTFANATSVAGTGTISNVVSDFNTSTRVSAGSGIDYTTGFTSVSTANGGDLTNVTGAFNLTGTTEGTNAGVAYSGFTTADGNTVTGAVDWDHGNLSNQGMTFANATSVTGTGDITNMGVNMNLTANNVGTAGGVAYSGFASSDTQSISGASGFDDTAFTTRNMTFANVTAVAGTGADRKSVV